MKFMVSWTVYPGKGPEANSRFLKWRAERRPPVKGVQTVGEWISVDNGRGWSVLESDSAEAVYESNGLWSDLLEFQTEPVVSHDDAESIQKRMSR
jgi:hypothetical protein